MLEAPCDPFVGIARLHDAPVSFYPNPATHTLTLQRQVGPFEVVIQDLNGRLILRDMGQLNGTQKLDVSTIPAGLYTVGILAQRHWHRAPLVVR